MQYKRRPAITLILAAVAAFLAGCAPALVGKWKGSMTGANPAGMEMEFRKDGSFVQSITPSAIGSITATGIYKTEGANLVLNVNEVESRIGGSSVKGTYSAREKERMNQEATYKLQGDKLDLNFGGKSATLAKVSE